MSAPTRRGRFDFNGSSGSVSFEDHSPAVVVAREGDRQRVPANLGGDPVQFTGEFRHGFGPAGGGGGFLADRLGEDYVQLGERPGPGREIRQQQAGDRRLFNCGDGRRASVSEIAFEEFVLGPAQPAADGFAPVGEVGHTGRRRQDHRRELPQATDDGIEQAAEDCRAVRTKRTPELDLGAPLIRANLIK